MIILYKYIGKGIIVNTLARTGINYTYSKYCSVKSLDIIL